MQCSSSDLVQVLEALCYMHRCNVVHLDIKPNNVMFAQVTELFRVLGAV